MDKQSKKDLKDKYKSREEIGGVFLIRCNAAEKYWLKSAADLNSAKNRFAFSQGMNLCPETSMLEDWKKFGGSAFSFEVLEEIKKKEDQTDREFADDVDTLHEMWIEKMSAEGGI